MEVERGRIEPKAIILEPVARNTAAAIAVAALAVVRENPNAILVVMPSDHVVRDEARFVESVKRAAKVAATGKLVLFGIIPREPHTGYGYIRQGAALEGLDNGGFTVDAFFEKPDIVTAQRYLAEGGYYWNSGIFVFHARTFLDELAAIEPRILAAARGALAHVKEDLGFLRLDAKFFSTSPSISVDYAVMEKTSSAAMLPVEFGWNDVGSWASLWEIAPRDANGNYANGDAVLEDSTGCYIHAEHRLVSTIGVDDLVIVDTPDALLVADKNRSQEVSKIVATLSNARIARSRSSTCVTIVHGATSKRSTSARAFR